MQPIFYAEDKPRARSVAEAFLPAVGGRRARPGEGFDPRAGLPVFYGVGTETLAAWNACLAAGRDYLYIDNGYFGGKDWFRVTRSAPQHDGLSGAGDPDRFARLGVPIRPWKSAAERGGGYVLVATQSPFWHRRHGTTIAAWVEDVARRVRAVSGRDIRVRVKPRFKGDREGAGESRLLAEGYARAAASDAPALAADLDFAWAVVVHSSNVAVDAALAGVPLFCTAPCAASAMGRDALELIENPVCPADPARAEWAARLAANQWTLAEMASGKCWADLNRDVSGAWHD